MNNNNIEIYKEYLESPGVKHALVETSDPVKAEKRYLRYALASSEIDPCRLIVKSNHPEVPDALLNIQGEVKNTPLYFREKNKQRRFSIWCNPDTTLMESGSVWAPPTGHQVRALKEMLLTPEGEEIPVIQLALKTGFRRRVFYNYFKNHGPGIQFLLWEKMLRMAGFSVLETTCLLAPPESIKEFKDAG